MHTGLPQPADSHRFSSVIAAAAKGVAGTALLVAICLMPGLLSAASTQAPTPVTNLTSPADQSTDPVSAPAARTFNYPDTGNGSTTVTSAADLSLLGILALGIIGLLWVRRHTSEL